MSMVPRLNIQTEALRQFLKIDAPVSTIGVLYALPDNEIRRPIHLGVEDVPHSRDIGGEARVVIPRSLDQDAVIAVRSQRQQTVQDAVPAVHTAFVLCDERLFLHGR